MERRQQFGGKNIKYKLCNKGSQISQPLQIAISKTPVALKEKLRDGSLASPLSSWHEARNIYAEAFKALTYYIHDHVIVNNEVFFVKHINSYYQGLLHEIGREKGYDLASTTQKLEDKLLKHFCEKVKKAKALKGKGNIIFSASIDIEEVVKKQQSKKQALTLNLSH